jgi:hypothetical protein
MGHFVRDSSDLFEGVSYNRKTSPELREAMQRKLIALHDLIEGREQRMKHLRAEYSIDAETLARLVMQFQKQSHGASVVNYNNQGDGKDRLIPAGVIANIIREQEMIDSERGQIHKIELILRNLRDTEPYNDEQTGETKTRGCIHQLNDTELEFLGF